MIDNPCEFIRRIARNPFARVEDLKESEILSLRKHLTECPECDKLVNEVLDTYDGILPPDQNTNDGRWN